MPLISHRGAAGLANENTLKSIVLAASFSPAYIEVDINSTADDQLVVFHGSTSRFFRGIKMAEGYDELTKSHPDTLSLRDLLEHKLSAPLLFDIKIVQQSLIEGIISLIRKSRISEFAFTSPHQTSLAQLKDAFPDKSIFQSQPYHHGPVLALEMARKHKFNGVAINKWWLTPLVYYLCKIHRKQIMFYTIDSTLGIWLGQRLYPKAYIVTNRPDKYRRLFPITTTE